MHDLNSAITSSTINQLSGLLAGLDIDIRARSPLAVLTLQVPFCFWAYKVRVLNKCDQRCADVPENWIGISAKYGSGVEELLAAIRATVDTSDILKGETVVSNGRHYEALIRSLAPLQRARTSLSEGIPTDLVAQDIREVLSTIGEITGEVTSGDILAEISSKFCIGK